MLSSCHTRSKLVCNARGAIAMSCKGSLVSLNLDATPTPLDPALLFADIGVRPLLAMPGDDEEEDEEEDEDEDEDGDEDEDEEGDDEDDADEDEDEE
jgi:hypothetical protein